MVFILSLILGISAGLRTMTPAAALCWAAFLGWIDLSATPFSFLGHPITLAILTVAALGEFVIDQLPQAPGRTVPVQFGARIVAGALGGGILGLPSTTWISGAMAGAVGAVLGTLGGHQARRRLVASNGGNDRPIALLEDAVAIGLALLAVWLVT
ncbi:DUF4126 family protein [Pelagibacterium sp.]|uniref:DUF4126 family protein n=1 Tax=Pelagibacterium sp. TaxID=1967288 RepID=UPI003A8F2ABE